MVDRPYPAPGTGQLVEEQPFCKLQYYADLS